MKPWLWRWGPAVAWAGLIWTLSTGSFSATATGHIILPVLHWLFPWASAETLQSLHGATRKCAHLAEYFVFGLLLLRSIRSGQRGWQLHWALTALAIAAAYAAFDELHQAFVPERTASVVDSLIDTTGAAAAQLLAWARAQWRA